MDGQCLYILSGLPFAGKSTLAKELICRLDLVYVELDAINSERGLGLDGKKISPEDWDKTYQEAYRRVEKILKADKTVLYEAANFTREQRAVLRAIADQLGIPSQVIYVDVPLAVVRQRLLQNRATQQRYDVRDDDFAQVVGHFQPPTEEENVVRYDGSVSVTEWIRQNF